jgi:hypothetical protein
MTHDEWIATEVRSTDPAALSDANRVMQGDVGYPYQGPGGWVEVASFEPVGVMVRRRDGQWWTQTENSDWLGDYESVLGRLWEWARHEVGGW